MNQSVPFELRKDQILQMFPPGLDILAFQTPDFATRVCIDLNIYIRELFGLAWKSDLDCLFKGRMFQDITPGYLYLVFKQFS